MKNTGLMQCTILLIGGVVLACSGDVRNSLPGTEAFEPSISRTPSKGPTITRERDGSREIWVVDGDQGFATDAELNAFLTQSEWPSLGLKTLYNSGQVLSSATALNMTYCYQEFSGNPAIEDFDEVLQAALRKWEGILALKFVHVPAYDGAGCYEAETSGDVVWRVGPRDIESCVAMASFAQTLKVPPTSLCGGSFSDKLDLFLHEVGHLLGRPHENYHPNNTTGCTDLNYSFDILAPFDPLSVMLTTGQCAGNVVNEYLSAGDVLGGRERHGLSKWWPVLVLN